MIKKLHPEAETASALALAPTPSPFPSPFLIVAGVVSCFLATGAFVASLTQVTSYLPYFLAPSGIGFFLTVPYHVSLYILAHKRRQAEEGTQFSRTFIPSDCLVWSFLIVTLWTVIFFINILFCVGWDGHSFGVITATILSGFEWIVLLLIALKSVWEVWLVEKADPSDPEHQAITNGASSDASADPHVPKNTPQLAFFASCVFCSVSLLFSISVSIACVINVIAFFITAPHHIALFIASVRPQPPNTLLYRPSPVPFTYFLTALWCGVFVVNVARGDVEAYQKIFSGIFGGLECMLLAYLAAGSVLDRFAEGRIRL